MNTAASNLLRSLESLGVLSVRFRVTGLGRCVRHTVPVGVADDENGESKRLTSLSVPELFTAYALSPRKGEYVLNVDGGQLAFIPPTTQRAALAMLKKHRTKSKSPSRHRRGSYSGAHHKLAA